MDVLIALAATAVLVYQMSYVFPAIGWAAIHDAFAARDVMVVALPIVLVWAGYGVARARRQAHAASWLLALSALVIGFTEVLLPVTPWKARSLQAAVDGTVVTDVRDAPILSAGGQPIGVRITYRVWFPRAGVYSVGPSISTPTRDVTTAIPAALQLGFRQEPLSRPEPERTDDGSERLFAADVDYDFTVDLEPSFLGGSVRTGERCIAVQPNRNYSETDFLNVVTQGFRSPYQFEMLVDGETVTRRRVAQQYVTAQEYDVREFYDGLIQGGVGRCAS